MVVNCTEEVLKILTLSSWEKMLVFAAVLFFERWLGRTDKVEAASTIDLVTNGIGVMSKKLVRTVHNKGEKHDAQGNRAPRKDR